MQIRRIYGIVNQAANVCILRVPVCARVFVYFLMNFPNGKSEKQSNHLFLLLVYLPLHCLSILIQCKCRILKYIKLKRVLSHQHQRA